MLSKRRQILISKLKPQFSKQPAKTFRNCSLGGIARPNLLYVGKFSTYPNIRDVEKVMSESTNAISDREVQNLKNPKQPKGITRNKSPKIPTILRGGAKHMKKELETETQTNPQKPSPSGSKKSSTKISKLPKVDLTVKKLPDVQKKNQTETQRGGKVVAMADETKIKNQEEIEATKKKKLKNDKEAPKEEEEETEDEEEKSNEEDMEDKESESDMEDEETDTESYNTDSESDDNTEQSLANALMHPLKVLKI